MKTRLAAVALAICLAAALAAAQRGAGGAGNARTAPAPGHAAAAPATGAHPGTAHAAPSAPSGAVVVRSPGMQRSAPVAAPSGAVIQRGWSGPATTPFNPVLPGGFISTGGHGLGNINHPGGVLPPGLQPLPLVTQPLPTGGAFTPSGRGFREHRNNNVIIYPIPVFVGGYGYYGYDGGVYPASPSSNTVVVEPEQSGAYDQSSQSGAESQQQYYVPSTFIPQTPPDQSSQAGSGIYTVGPAYSPGQPAPALTALTLLVFKDHSIYAATDYWRQGDRLHYLTNYGAKNSIPLDQLDMDMTVQLNRERSVPFILVERKP